MGRSTNAFLVYGIDLGAREEREPIPILDDEDSDMEELIYHHYTLAEAPQRPTEDYPELEIKDKDGALKWPSVQRPATPEEQEIIDRYYAFWDAKSELAKHVDVSLLLTGSYDYPGDILYVGDTLSVEWTETADAKAFLDEQPGDSASREKLRVFCDRTGIPFTEPKWLLTTRYY